MVRLVVSQWLEPDTLLSPLANVTFHDTLVLAVTVKIVLFVVSDCGGRRRAAAPGVPASGAPGRGTYRSMAPPWEAPKPTYRLPPVARSRT